MCSPTNCLKSGTKRFVEHNLLSLPERKCLCCYKINMYLSTHHGCCWCHNSANLSHVLSRESTNASSLVNKECSHLRAGGGWVLEEFSMRHGMSEGLYFLEVISGNTSNSKGKSSTNIMREHYNKKHLWIQLTVNEGLWRNVVFEIQNQIWFYKCPFTRIAWQKNWNYKFHWPSN